MRCGHGSNFEIFEYEAPDQRREMPKMSDWGGVHLAFYVDDMEAALAYSRTSRACRFSEAPRRRWESRRAKVRPSPTS
jgi:catechol 2,3-dioxygenase-like lactoylglutathione lyase family enzyme